MKYSARRDGDGDRCTSSSTPRNNITEQHRRRSKSAAEPPILRMNSRPISQTPSRPVTTSGRGAATDPTLPPKPCRRCRTAVYPQPSSSKRHSPTKQGDNARVNHLLKEDLKRLSKNIWGNWREHIKSYNKKERLLHMAVSIIKNL